MTLSWHRPERRRVGPLEAVAGVALVLLLVARFVPVARIVPFWGCPLRRTTGFPCLSCGLTRAFDRVAHFNFLGALDANPLGALAAMSLGATVAFAIVANIWLIPRPHLALTERDWRFVRWTLVLALAANWGWVIARTLSS